MRLEVLVDSEDPKIFPLNQAEILIGSGETCDIILDADGISRKHVKIISSGDQFFVVDQGSTNGTYINEERLIPGRKTDFTSFFPVRLGDNVFLTLLSDEEAADSELSSFAKKIEERERTLSFDSNESTKAFSVNELNKTPKKLELQQAKKTRSTAVQKKSLPKEKKEKKEKNNMGMTVILVVLLLAGGIYYQSMDKHETAEATKQDLEPKVVAKKAVEEIKPVNEPPKIEWKIADEDIIPKTKMEVYLNDLKCFNTEEKFFCDLIPEMSEKDGVIQVGASFVFLLEQKKWIEMAKQLLEIKVEEQAAGESTVFSPELYRLGLLLAMKKILTLNNTQNFKEMNFYLALYDGTATENIIKFAFAVKRISIEQIIPYVDEFNFSRVKQYGVKAIKDSEIYYSFY